jgi:hypothetical protein
MKTVHRETVQKTVGIMNRMLGEIDQELTPEQRKIAEHLAPRQEDLTIDLLNRIDAVEVAAQQRRQHAENIRTRIDEAIKASAPDTHERKTQTNNYHQVRMGAALAGLEIVNFALYFTKSEEAGNEEQSLEIWASGLSVAAILLDCTYALIKSEREVLADATYTLGKSQTAGLPDNWRTDPLRSGGDIVRGGFKLAAGMFALSAGVITSVLESNKALKEWGSEGLTGNALLYTAKAGVSIVSTALSFGAAFSYSGPLLQRAVLLTPKGSQLGRALTWLAKIATRWGKRVFLLRYVSYANAAGLALMAVEAGIWIWRKFQPGPLEQWCKRSMFANPSHKTSPGYSSATTELEGLAQAMKLENQ